MVALLVVGGFGFAGTSTVTVTEGPAAPAAEHDLPYVVSTHETSPGFSLFGLDFGSRDFVAHVAVVPPPGCLPDNDNHIQPGGGCEGIVATGPVTGDGTSIAGDRFFIVAVDVREACYDVLVPGDPWPAPHSACGDNQPRTILIEGALPARSPLNTPSASANR